MSRDSEAPLEPDRRRISVPVAVAITALFTMASVVAAASAVWSGDHRSVEEARETNKEQDARIRVLETTIATMQADLRETRNDAGWIRRTLERQAK
jgi:hypothetical protein